MPKAIPTLLSVIGILWRVTAAAYGQPDFHYSMESERRDATSHFFERLTVTVNKMNGSPDRLIYRKGVEILGVLGPSREFRDESLNCAISREELDTFFAELDALKLGDLPPDEPKNSSGAFGHLNWKRELKIFQSLPVSGKKKKLEEKVISFVASQQTKRPEEFQKQVYTVVGDDTKPMDTSLKDILRDPKSYSGKRVRVSGYYHAEDEHSSISVSKEPVGKYDYSQSIWLGGASSFAKPKETEYRKDTFLTVEGTFYFVPGGSMGLGPGEIRRVTKAIAK